MELPENDSGWHLDKRIPIATLITMVSMMIFGVLHIAEIRKDGELRDMNQKLGRLIESRK